MLDQMKKYNPKEFFKKFKKKTLFVIKGIFQNFMSIFVAYLEHVKKMMNVILC